MTRRHLTALAALALTLVCASPASAWDSPLEPVTPAADNTQPHGTGLIVPTQPQVVTRAEAGEVRAEAATVPTSVDLTQWAMPVGDQGQIGACAAWAADYSAMGYWMNKQNIAGGPLAPMFTYSQYSYTYKGGRDEGSTLDYHTSVAKTTGVDSLVDYQPQGNYNFTAQPTVAQKANAANWKISDSSLLAVQQSAGSSVTQDAIKTALAAGKPVVIGMPVYTTFEALRTANSGLYNPGSSLGTYRGGHAVTALGYDATGVRVQNQWGTWWGDSGYATLSWSFVNQYVFQAMEVGPLVSADPKPKLVAAPTVSGSTTRGGALSATSGTYTANPTNFAYQWQRDGVDIQGATSSSYTTSADDVDAYVRVQVTAGNADGEVKAVSAAAGPINPTPPTSTSAPVLSGTLKRGEVLAVTRGQWTDTPTNFTYVWQRDKGSGYTTITGATTSLYQLTSTDVAARIRVSVSARNSAGISAATPSNTVGAVGPNPPVNSIRPVISGDVERGSQLTSTVGTWAGANNVYRYQWQRYANSAWANISNATTPVYTPVQADQGLTLRMQVTATNSDGTVVVVSDATVAVAATPPVAQTMTPPVGTTTRGSALIAGPGDWEGAGNTYRYQWQRRSGNGAWTNIAGAISISYTLQLVDEGANLRAQITATNVDGTATANSPEVGPIADAPPFNTQVPVVAGTPARGTTVSVNTGHWNGNNNVYSYQWQKDSGSGFADIPGATRNTYVAQMTDEGAQLRAEVTATNPDDTVAAYSDPTAPVAASPPVNTIVPVVTGIVARTRPLSATPGTWTPSGNVYSYQWQRDTGSGYTDIAGASSSVYVLTANDTGATVRIKVSATNVDATVVAYSNPTITVGSAPPASQGIPVATGISKTGQTVSTTPGTWLPANPTVAYQWQADDGTGFAEIAGATAATYTLTDDEATLRVRAQVTATNQDGSTVAYSNALGPVLATPVNSVEPDITGTFTDAEVLNASTGTWASAGGLTHTYKYQWVRCVPAATSTTGCNSIVGANGATYTTVTGDVGYRLAVKVTATNSQGVPAVVGSHVTDVLQGRALSNVTLPEIVGLAGVREKLTVTSGTWTVALTRATYQWTRCFADLSSCEDIPSATTSTYTPTPADLAKVLKVTVNVWSAGRTAAVESTPSAPVAPLPTPSTATPVSISGAPARQQVLRATMPKWDGYPTAYAYGWLRCDTAGDNCTPIAGARGNAYILTKDDEGSTIRVTMTATNSAGSGDTTSDQSGVVQPVQSVSTVAPSITGVPVQGQLMLANKGVWSTTSDTTYAFVWQRCLADGSNCASIPGSTLSSYRTTPDDVGLTLKLTVAATNADGIVNASSAVSAPIKPAPPTASPAPTLLGVAQVGKEATVNIGTWSNVSQTPKVTFWRCTTVCAAIVTSTTKTYTLTNADAGFRIRASVTGVGGGGTTTIYATAIIGTVKAPTVGAVVASAAPTAAKSSTGAKLATVMAKTPAAGGNATVTVTPAKSLKQGYKAWACPMGEFEPCTKPIKLSRKATKFKVAVDAGEKVTVVVAKK